MRWWFLRMMCKACGEKYNKFLTELVIVWRREERQTTTSLQLGSWKVFKEADEFGLAKGLQSLQARKKGERRNGKIGKKRSFPNDVNIAFGKRVYCAI